MEWTGFVRLTITLGWRCSSLCITEYVQDVRSTIPFPLMRGPAFPRREVWNCHLQSFGKEALKIRAIDASHKVRTRTQKYMHPARPARPARPDPRHARHDADMEAYDLHVHSTSSSSAPPTQRHPPTQLRLSHMAKTSPELLTWENLSESIAIGHGTRETAAP